MPSPYDYASTQVNIKPGSQAHTDLAFLKSKIKSDDLAGAGFEDEPHITVCYGLIDGEDKAREFLGKQKPFTAKLGKTKSFTPSEHSDGAAPLFVEVHSPELSAINTGLRKAANFKPSDFDYTPHSTLAYVKPETASSYEGMNAAEGTPIDVRSIHISHKDGSQEEVPLNGSTSKRSSNQDKNEVVHKHLRDKLHIKSLSETGEFEGYASTYSIDLDNERIAGPEAFKRTLQHTNGVVPILFGHSTNEPAGWNLEATADSVGLRVRGKLAIETEIGRKSYYFIKGALDAGAKGAGLSIGFRVIKSHYETLKEDDAASGLRKGTEIRVFDEVSLMEYSVCVFQANINSYVTAVKSKFDQDQKKEISEGLDLGMSETAKGSAPTKRVDGVDLPASAFAYVGDPEKTDTWKLPIHFPTPDQSASHVRNALARFDQTDGIPESEKPKVLARIHAAAHSHGIDANKGTEQAVDETKAMTSGDASSSPDFDSNLRAAQRQRESRKQRSDIDDALYQTLSAIHAGDMDVPGKKAAVADCYQKHCKAMTSWHMGTYFPSDSGDSKSFDSAILRKEDASLYLTSQGASFALPMVGISNAPTENKNADDDIEQKESPFKGGKIAKRLMKSFMKVHKAHHEHGEVMKDMFGSDPGDDGVAPTATDEMGAMSENTEDTTQKGGDPVPAVVEPPNVGGGSNLENSGPNPGQTIEAKAATEGQESQQQADDGDSGNHSLIQDLLTESKSRLELINARN